jgi:hypothetical protein
MGLYLPSTFVSRAQFADEMRRRQRAKEVERFITMTIQKEYPEHLFTVQVSPEDGTVLIDHPLLRHSKARYVLHFAKRDDLGKAAVKMAGEILERANVKRGELKFYEEYDGRADELAKTQFSAR